MFISYMLSTTWTGVSKSFFQKKQSEVKLKGAPKKTPVAFYLDLQISGVMVEMYFFLAPFSIRFKALQELGFGANKTCRRFKQREIRDGSWGVLGDVICVFFKPKVDGISPMCVLVYGGPEKLP